MRKAGLPLTKKAQEEQARREQMRLKLLQSAAAQGIALPGSSGGMSISKPDAILVFAWPTS